MGKHVHPTSLEGIKYSKSIGFDSSIEMFALNNLFMKLALRSILTVVAYIQLKGGKFPR